MAVIDFGKYIVRESDEMRSEPGRLEVACVEGVGAYVCQIVFATRRAKLSGAVYCNRPCLWVCVFVCRGLLAR